MIPGWLALRADWTWHSVKELQHEGVLLVEDGNHGEDRPRPDQFTNDGTPFLRAADLSDGHVLFSTAGRINNAALRRIRKGIGKPGDVLFSHKGTVGKLALAPEGAPAFVCSPQTTFWRVTDRSRLDRQFLFAYMRAPEFQRQWTVRKGDTDMADYVSLTAQRTLLVPVPSMSTQRKIAAIVTAYDERIENNRRRINILEEMTQRIYREWFVDFRYPGHENVLLVDSELGPMPDGWKIGTIGDLVDVNSATIRKIEQGESIHYIDIASVLRGEIQATRKMLLADAPGRARRRVADGDILWSTVRPNLRGHALVLSPEKDCVASTGFAVLSPRRASFAYVYALTTTDDFVEYLSGLATGSAYPAVTPGVFEAAPIVVPHRRVIDEFATLCEPPLRLASRLRVQSATLSATRDLLLPRLISGQIDVSDLDVATADAAA